MFIAMQTTISYLIPGVAENFEKKARENRNLLCVEVAKGIKVFRNVLCTSVALSIIAGIGALRTTGAKFGTLATVTVLSGTLAALAFRIIYVDVVKYIIPQSSKE